MFFHTESTVLSLENYGLQKRGHATLHPSITRRIYDEDKEFNRNKLVDALDSTEVIYSAT